ncbi:BZ3500_MvSof-1268-A1-R1_Chr3-1g05622 [Microbotryum saponariae]|uniref:BZ3500_MvSof-1268-A1-R1_Chr3-1g05622 protein n=1 Tax=Microbotryum saponariae TaxID=289078 RepID=A0A2X0KX28_9BASI|nr:BZ3500_MvSof-1268-A1-R1_Chr3-1g05622 [Microbotryum saponariae]SDA04812.1 BZ3501_MvSof-1269-A2-R1_Chr3-1g05292 [Microbotryum saponariae]
MFGGTSSFGGFGQQQQNQQQQQSQQQQQQQQQQPGGLFGNTASTFGSAFGQPQQANGAFGQPAAATPSFGGGFGAGNTTTPAFGQAASTSAFGAQPTGGLFGTPATPAANTGFSFGMPAGGGSTGFGAPTTSAAPASGGLFGAPKPAASTFGGFAAAGQQQQQQPAPGGGLFGSAAGGFGQQVQIAPGSGTAAVQYQPTTVMEPPKEEGKPDPPNQTPHQFQSICCMPPYSNYSFEELRLQDYQANRKTPTASTSAPSFGGAFGQTTATPAFGAAPAQGGGLFGSTTPGFGAAQPATNAFGQSQPQQQGGGLFGAAGTSAFGQPAQQSGGLFGGATSQPAQTGGLFGSTSTAGTTGGLFGQPQQQQQQQQAQPSFGGFGQAAAKPANTGFSFGATSTAPASGGLFGQTQQQPQQAGGLFGQPQQQAGATGGLFGQPAQNAGATGGFNFGGTSSAAKPLFGSAPTASSAPAFGTSTAASAPKPAFSFGAAPAAGGSLFGTPAQQQQQQPATNAFGATPSSGGGLFGGGGNTFGQPAATQQQQNTSSLFGSGSGSLFGAPKPAAPTTGGGLFGGGSSTTSSLFGASQPQQQQQFQQPQQQQPGSLFGSTMLGGSSGFGQSTAPQQAQQPTAYATADDVNAYGANPLFQGSASRTGAPTVEEKKKPIFTSFRGTPVNRSATKITRLRGFGGSSLVSKSAGNGSPLSFGSSIGPNGSGSPSVGATPGSPAGGRSSPLRLVNGIGDDAALSPNAFVTRQSFKKLVIAPKHLNGGLATGSPAPAGFNGSVASKNGGTRPKVSFDPAVETSSRERGQLAESTSSAANESSFAGFEATPSKKSGTNSGSSLTDDSFAAQVSTTPAGWPPRRSPASAASTPTKVGAYYTVPSLDALKKLPAASLRAVPDLVVGRVGYGRVAFKAPVDLTTLPSLDDLLGSIVVFEDRNCSVYPNDYDDDKPEVGQGLNVPATITLEKCWPLDKATRNPIKDPKHPKLSQHIKRLRGLEGTRYIDFSPEDGVWKFAVESF